MIFPWKPWKLWLIPLNILNLTMKLAIYHYNYPMPITSMIIHDNYSDIKPYEMDMKSIHYYIYIYIMDIKPQTSLISQLVDSSTGWHSGFATRRRDPKCHVPAGWHEPREPRADGNCLGGRKKLLYSWEMMVAYVDSNGFIYANIIYIFTETIIVYEW